MAIDRRTRLPDATLLPPRTRRRIGGGGTDGNELLTAATGATLIALLAVIGVTIVRLHPLLSVHLFVGVLLIPPILLKLAGTGYRFVRYYTRNASYVEKGPPPTALRLIAPIVVLTTLVVFASGVALLFAGPQARGTLLPIHKVSFFVWIAFTAIHVLAHLPALAPALRADYGRRAQPVDDVPGRDGRVMSLAGALVAGVVLAILTIPEFASWLHATGPIHHH